MENLKVSKKNGKKFICCYYKESTVESIKNAAKKNKCSIQSFMNCIVNSYFDNPKPVNELTQLDFEYQFAKIAERTGIADLCRRCECAEKLEDLMIILERKLFK